MNSYEYQSPEGKVIVWPLSKVIQIYTFKHPLLQSRLAHCSQISSRAFMGYKNENLFKHMTKMAIPYMLKKYSSLKPVCRWLRTWYTASGFRPYKVCSTNDPGLTLTYCTARSILLPSSAPCSLVVPRSRSLFDLCLMLLRYIPKLLDTSKTNFL